MYVHCKNILIIRIRNYYSPQSKELWGRFCQSRFVYLQIFATWLLPTLLNLPKSFEDGVSFAPGKNLASVNASDIGYICYSRVNDSSVMWTDTQFDLNMATDILVLLTIVISGGLSWLAFRREVDENRSKIEHNEINLFRYNLIAKLKERNLNLSISIICIIYIVCRFPFALSSQLSLNTSTLWLMFCFILYNFQFSLHFLVYPTFQPHYRNAYCDVLRPIYNKLCRCCQQ